MNFHQFLIPRLEGREIESNFGYYLDLVKQGIGGFIIFGGELEPVREGIRKLQGEAALPLLIASDLEQGLGQQLTGGTLFPPAMAMAEAAEKDPDAVRQAFSLMAREAAHAGINVILAPVLDINSNPDNPIICTRAFCDSPERVAALGGEMITAIQAEGVMACGKHFPGHGATDIDSHIALPEISKSLEELEAFELLPFRQAVKAGVEMLMTGHLSVPALDPSGTPITVSAHGIEYIRRKLGFQGMLISDAMNMGGIAGQMSGPAYLALKAGIDIVLHPDEPGRVAKELEDSDLQLSDERMSAFRNRLIPSSANVRPDGGPELSRKLTELSLKIEGSARPLRNPFVITLTDEAQPRGNEFIASLGASAHRHITPETTDVALDIPRNAEVVVAVFSEPKAWKGQTIKWIRQKVRELAKASALFVAFGNPYTISEVRLDDVRKGAVKAYAYWTAPAAQRAMAAKLRQLAED